MQPKPFLIPLLATGLALPAVSLPVQDPPPTGSVGVEERLGSLVPLELTVTAADGRTVHLSEFIDRPTILALVFYRCPDICSPLLMGLSRAIERTETPPGESYRVLVFSFNPDETPTDARHAQTHIQGMFPPPWPDQDWIFAVADSVTIRTLTEAVGFHYKRIGDDFNHPAVVTMLSEQGRIIRYLYGLTFVPFDLRMALLEAAEGRVGASVNRVMLYCFSYDPEGRTYVFNIVKVTGTLIVAMAITLFLFLMILNARRKTSLRGESHE
jgi:protein SCO1